MVYIMSSMTIINARAVVGGTLRLCNLKLADGRIKGIMPPGDTYGKTYDAKEHLVLPGFIDIHTHGGKGIDFNNSDAVAIESARDFFASQGVTTFLPTVHTDSEETMLRSILSIVKAKNNLGCVQIFGIHLEGPFLSPAYCDAEEVPLLQPCSYPLFKRLQDASGGNIRLLTLSPELGGAAALTRKLSMEGVRVS
ncbi:MAG: amidohydrolase family protein, partial [Angelakisella sp.]